MARGDFTPEEVPVVCAEIAQRYLGDGIHAVLTEEQNMAVFRALGAVYHAGV